MEKILRIGRDSFRTQCCRDCTECWIWMLHWEDWVKLWSNLKQTRYYNIRVELLYRLRVKNRTPPYLAALPTTQQRYKHGNEIKWLMQDLILPPNMWRRGFWANTTNFKEKGTLFRKFHSLSHCDGPKMIKRVRIYPKDRKLHRGRGRIRLPLRYRVRSDRFTAADLNGR
jgi:hypothetical protein